jgi:hypothetical protein
VSYAATALRAQVQVARYGAAVTFSRSVAATYDAATDTGSPTVTSATGNAVQKKADPRRYAALQSAGLVLVNPVTLLVAASALSTFVPTPGDAVTFASVVRKVAAVDVVAPDGTAIVYDVVASA